jgi:hypothetical protein
MEKQGLILGLQITPSSIIRYDDNANYRIKHEVVNTVANQVVKLRKNGHNVFLFFSQVAEYCQKYYCSQALCSAFGKKEIVDIFSNSFKRRKITVCPLDSDVRNIKGSVIDAFEQDMAPIISGNVAIGGWEAEVLPDCEEGDVYFAFLCEVLNADIAVIAAGKKDVKRKEDIFRMLFLQQSVKPQVVPSYQSNFLLNAGG